MNMPVEQRIESYDKNHCWQYDIRINNLEEDLRITNLTLDETQLLRVSDFDLQYEENIIDEARDFIKRHEWLGTLSNYPTHFFHGSLQWNFGGNYCYGYAVCPF